MPGGWGSVCDVAMCAREKFVGSRVPRNRGSFQGTNNRWNGLIVDFENLGGVRVVDNGRASIVLTVFAQLF